MKICISGQSASGKTTVGAMLAKYLGIKHVELSYKRDANSNRELLGILKESKAKYAKSFDDEVRSMARGNCVITTWLSPWIVKGSTLNVRLYADESVRAKRVMKRERIGRAAALRYVREKDKLTIAHFKKVYGINVTDDLKFDIEINTGKMETRRAVAIIALAAMLKEKNRFD